MTSKEDIFEGYPDPGYPHPRPLYETRKDFAKKKLRVKARIEYECLKKKWNNIIDNPGRNVDTRSLTVWDGGDRFVGFIVPPVYEKPAGPNLFLWNGGGLYWIGAEVITTPKCPHVVSGGLFTGPLQVGEKRQIVHEKGGPFIGPLQEGESREVVEIEGGLFVGPLRAGEKREVVDNDGDIVAGDTPAVNNGNGGGHFVPYREDGYTFNRWISAGETEDNAVSPLRARRRSGNAAGKKPEIIHDSSSYISAIASKRAVIIHSGSSSEADDEYSSTTNPAPIRPPPPPPPPPFNPVDGIATGRQTKETVDEFLNRLPLLKTQDKSHRFPYISISSSKLTEEQYMVGRTPHAQAERLVGLQEARSLLARFVAFQESPISNQHTRDYAVNITERDILRIGRYHGVLSGKWVIKFDEDYLEWAWGKIAHATARGWLGATAKFPIPNISRKIVQKPMYEIQVSLDNCFDPDEVRRVLFVLKDMDLFDVSYDCYCRSDMHDLLGIGVKNIYMIRAKMYSATWLMAADAERELLAPIEAAAYALAVNQRNAAISSRMAFQARQKTMMRDYGIRAAVKARLAADKKELNDTMDRNILARKNAKKAADAAFDLACVAGKNAKRMRDKASREAEKFARILSDKKRAKEKKDEAARRKAELEAMKIKKKKNQ